MADTTHLSLLARIQETQVGDSWNEFIQMYDGMIRGWLYCQGVQSQDADDIRQEVMSIVVREVGNFKHNGRTGAFRAWLKAITRNCLSDHWRKANRHAHVGPDLGEIAAALEDTASPQSRMWDAEHDRYVIHHLLSQISERLSEQSVTVFRRVVLEQEDAKKVADEMQMKVGAVRVAQHRVLKALKDAGTGLVEI